MPALQPVEIWQESGRHGNMGGILMEFTLGGDRHVVLGPTHEEAVTDIVRDLIKSYRQLPLTLYQIQTKFRNEPRPRFGILRTREFVMKDAYSFGADLEAARTPPTTPCTRPTAGSSTAAGSPTSRSRPRAGRSAATARTSSWSPAPWARTCDPVRRVGLRRQPRARRGRQDRLARAGRPVGTRVRDGRHTRAAARSPRSATSSGSAENETAKLLVFLADDKPVAVLVRGDHEANEGKVRRAFNATKIEPADPAMIEKITGAPMGYLGPVGIKIPMVVDQSVAAMPQVVVGGNARRRPPDGRGAGPRLPARPRGRLPQRRGGRPVPEIGQADDRWRRGSRSATSSSSGPSTRPPWARRSSTIRACPSRSSWAATASA